MAHLSRKCTRCGSFDTRESWSSEAEAASKGAFEGSWTCSTCAWNEFELVDRDAEPVGESSAPR
jgi:hypothetical protein